MKLPKKFIVSGPHHEWEVTRLDNGKYQYEVIRNGYKAGVTGTYLEKDVLNWLENPIYRHFIKEIIEQGDEVANGVNAQGEKLNFTKDDLKPFMRVTTRNGNQYIVVPDERHGVALARQLGWMDVCFNEGDEGADEEYMIDYVYSAPKHAYKMIDETATGDLLWKRQEPVAEENSEFNVRLAYLQTHIDAVKENLESLQEEYDQLKKEVHA